MSKRAPHVLTCMVMVTFADLALKVLGLRRAVRLTRWAAGPADGSSPEAQSLVAETAHRVAIAAAFYPGRAQCLEQSLALYFLLRRRGLAVELRIGVQAFPFAAHAWVEHDGRPINELEDFVSRLAPFPSMGG